jgi:hypothetical protein
MGEEMAGEALIVATYLGEHCVNVYVSLFQLIAREGARATDINRDSLWKLTEPLGYRPVSQVSLDATWSSMGFRPLDAVKSR